MIRPTRREFLRRLATLAAGGAVCRAAGAAAGPAGRKRPGAGGKPNFVILYADDLGYGDLACYGHPRFKTPNLDRMAREGVRLTDFYSACPYCAPSRAALMTGRYPFRNHLMPGNPCPKQDPAGPKSDAADSRGLPAEEITLGEALQKAGYRTSCIGKWHLGHQARFLPTRSGFHEYFGILYSNDMHPVELWDNEKKVEFPVEQSTLTRRYTERAVRFLEANKARPFLLYLPHAMPHKPLAASEAFYRKTGTGLYGDTIAELDWSVGRILATLKRLGLERRTLVFFSSDNGPWYGGSTGGLRGMKGRWWEGGYRVPLIAWRPGTIPPGQVIQEPAMIMDLFTTVLTAAGVPLPADRVIDGRDLLPVLTSGAKSPHEALFCYQGGVRTVRVGRWKLHVRVPGAPRRKPGWVDPRAPNGKTLLAPKEQYGPEAHPGVTGGDRPKGVALFDVEKDRAEQHDLADEHPAVVARLRALLRRMEQERGKPIGAGRPVRGWVARGLER